MLKKTELDAEPSPPGITENISSAAAPMNEDAIPCPVRGGKNSPR